MTRDAAVEYRRGLPFTSRTWLPVDIMSSVEHDANTTQCVALPPRLNPASQSHLKINYEIHRYKEAIYVRHYRVGID
jgi:hypothetical protein